VWSCGLVSGDKYRAVRPPIALSEWKLFNLPGVKIPLDSLPLDRGSETIAVYYWKWNGAKFALGRKWKF
jgi:hypothetical protein